MKQPPTNICYPRRQCSLCLRYRAPRSGSQHVTDKRAKRKRFVCAECMEKRS